MLIDTHCHIHDRAFAQKFGVKTPQAMIADAKAAGVQSFVCVGTDLSSSQQAVSFCQENADCYASLALHPHEAERLNIQDMKAEMDQLTELCAAEATADSTSKIVAIGECGLDYFYHDDVATHDLQKALLRRHFELAQKFDLPMIFHIRNASGTDGGVVDDPVTPHAFAEFFELFDQFPGIRGVVHSFSATSHELDQALERGLYIGLNGIMTFTKDKSQLAAAQAVPKDRLVLETDAPFLTPAPHRGKMCEPRHVAVTAQFLSRLRGEDQEQLSTYTTRNAQTLFGI